MSDNSNAEDIDVVRAWKDEEYRNSLTPEQLAAIPPNPAGESVMGEEDLDEVNGGLGNRVGGGTLICTLKTMDIYCYPLQNKL